jgi:glucokinase
MAKWVVGIDLGATKIALGLISPDNEIVTRRRILTNAPAGPEQAVERMVASLAELKDSLPAGQAISAVGICSPGPIDHEAGLIVDPPNLTGWRNVPLQRMLADRLALPVRLEHDAKAAALGEYHYGAGQGERSMVYIVAGTGVGAALIVDGQLYRGMHNFAGEVGHITIDRDGEPCGSGVRGCVQGYLCGPALADNYRKLQASQGLPVTNDITGEQVAHRAGAGETLARQVLTQAGEALGITVASMAMILDIELFVVGGSVVKAGDLLLAPARSIVPHYCFESVAAKTRIEAVALGDDSPLLGCAWLARQALETWCG